MSNKELVERLNEPELHYLGNFDTVKRANALLMCLCQEAADALELADKRIAELSRENQAQLDELHAIAEALGTSEGHSSVHHVTELRRKLDVAREALLYISQVACSLSPEQKVSNEALAQIGGEEK